MKVTKASISNFRLLEDAHIALDGETTMIVGRNNSGKTSVVEMFRKLAGADRTPFAFDDMSLSTHAKFEACLASYEAHLAAIAAGDQGEADRHLEALADVPYIQLVLTIEYESTDNITPLAPFILDLDPDRADATIVFRTQIRDPLSLFVAYEESKARKPLDIVTFLRKEFPKHSSSVVEAVDAGDDTNRRRVSQSELANLLSIGFIYAQNPIDDLASDSSRSLSKGFEEFFKSHETGNAAAETIADLLETAGLELDDQYKVLFESIYEDLKTFGVGRMPGLPELSVISELGSVQVLRGSAFLYYNDSGQAKRLPEKHNGLGYSKLIFTIMQFIKFYEELKRSSPEPPLQLIFVEEPEAHLHPQMQYVFVNSIRGFISSKSDWNAQTIITTHSSHMVAESGFSCIRYFDNSVSPLQVRDLAEFQLVQNKTDEGKAALKFLQQYMVLNRCDMFFADKVVLIEGTVERLLLPEMMRRVATDLAHKYVSVIEVGGAYAHIFKGIVDFLNIQTLVVTDLDSVDPADRRKAVPASSGMVTSNQTLIKWLPRLSAVDELLALAEDVKVEGRVRVAFQVPEAPGDATGRSFEQAFILANSSELAVADLASKVAFQRDDLNRLSPQEIRTESWAVAARIPKKTDFAFDILGMNDWNVPRYIKEGLLWLNQDL